MSTQKKYAPHPRVRIRREDFGGVAYHYDQEKAYLLNRTGVELIILLAEGLTPTQIVEKWANDYPDVEQPSLERDVAQIIAEMYDKALLILRDI